MNIPAAFQRAKELVPANANPDIDGVAGECASVIALTLFLLVLAFWNGFPLIYYDTGAYVLEGLGRHFLVERSPVYSLFLRFADGRSSLWAIIIVQAVMSAFVIVECARCVAPKLRLFSFAALSAALIVATGLPWYVCEVEPDCFAPLAVIGFYLLAFHTRTLGTGRTCVLVAIAAFATASHTSHLLLIGALSMAFAAYFAFRVLSKDGVAWPRLHLMNMVATLAIAASLILASNYYFTRQIFISRAGPAFLFARLLQDHIVTRLLDDTCPVSGYKLCAYKDVLPPTANAWLWAPYSPFFKLGGFAGTQAESQQIIWDGLKRYPFENARVAAADTVHQFLSFKTGDQVEPQQWALYHTFAAYLPSQVGPYLAARQQSGRIAFGYLNVVHVAVGYLSLLALVGLLFRLAWFREWEGSVFLGGILLALLANATICGVLSNPHDRYQSRLMWMCPYAICLVWIAHAPTLKQKRVKRQI